MKFNTMMMRTTAAMYDEKGIFTAYNHGISSDGTIIRAYHHLYHECT